MYNIRSFYNLSDMTIEKLDGTSPRLYTLVAPLVMRRSVLRQNNNYPFWTSRAHTWFVAWEGETVFDYTIRSVTLLRHAEVFRTEGFVPTKEWTQYVTMQYGKKRQP